MTVDDRHYTHARTQQTISTVTMDLSKRLVIGKQSFILPGFAVDSATALLTLIKAVCDQSPFRHMCTPRGYEMSAQMTNCGHYGWVTDRQGYRYQAEDPLTGQPWPPMPEFIAELAIQAAADCGFNGFEPDICLINCYQPGAGMGLHQDKDEQNFTQPIVSVSLGVPAIFLFGGHKRSDRTEAHLLRHGDVMVWGGEDRLRFHGVRPLKLAQHSLTGQRRFNLTLRRAG